MTREEAARILDETPIRILGITDALTYIEALEMGAEALREYGRSKGYWIVVDKSPYGANTLQCSNCKKVRKGSIKSAFCRDCGADMRENTNQIMQLAKK